MSFINTEFHAKHWHIMFIPFYLFVLLFPFYCFSFNMVAHILDDAYHVAAPSLFPLVDGDAYRLDDKHYL
jgi:hypothetical protein